MERDEAFEELVRAHRAELRAHCYRMLGSLHDAEDVLQETLIRAWRNLGSFRGDSSPRTWLFRIATNASLDALRRRRPDVEVPLEPYPVEPGERVEQRESLRLAFVAALRYLPPNQRAALLMKDVLGIPSKEIAETLETTRAAVDSALQHARRTVRTRVPDPGGLADPVDPGTKALVERYVQALEAADVEGLLALLTDDATWTMPPEPGCAGLSAIAGFLREGPMNERWRHRPIVANGQPAVACYLWDGSRYTGYVIDVLTVRAGRIAGVAAFVDPSLFPLFGLPEGLT